jgi:hypothetical protein
VTYDHKCDFSHVVFSYLGEVYAWIAGTDARKKRATQCTPESNRARLLEVALAWGHHNRDSIGGDWKIKIRTALGDDKVCFLTCTLPWTEKCHTGELARMFPVRYR